MFDDSHKWGWGIIDIIKTICAGMGKPDSVQDAVLSVEERAELISDAVKSAEKRAAAIEALGEVFRPRFCPKLIFRVIAGMLVDHVVARLNEKYGHDWSIAEGTK